MAQLNALVAACEAFPGDKAIHMDVSNVFRRLNQGQEAIDVLGLFVDPRDDPDGRREAEGLINEIEATGK